jgi:hypothetical protein
MKEMVLFGVDGISLRTALRHEQEPPELFVVGDQVIEREFLSIAFERTSPHSVAAVSSNGVKPGGQSVGALKLGEMFERSKEDLLHCVLGILTMPAHLHAERKDSILQKPNSLFDCFGRVLLQQFGCLDDFTSHLGESLSV